jgi:hypothetical protein
MPVILPSTDWTGNVMTTVGPTTAVDAHAITRMSRPELDQLFRNCPSGPIPTGRARGTAILLPGSAINGAIGALVRALVWKGKLFRTATGDLKNRIGPLGMPLIRAQVYQDQSWFAKGPAIILDYSKTSFVARMIRDEIRQVAPGLYLGQVYWGKRRIALFMLEFPPGAQS